MVWIYFLLLLLTDLCGLLLVAFTLPGLWLMLAAAAGYAWLTHANFLGKTTLITLLLLALFAEIAEFVFGGAGAKKAGATKWGIVGSLVGAVAGGLLLTALIPVIPPVNAIIGICLGSFTGAFGVEMLLGTPMNQSLRIGFGAAKGRLTGIVGKVVVGVAMLLISFFNGFPTHLWW